MVNKIKTLTLFILNLPLYWISCVINKNKKLWIFGAWSGKKYCDSSKYLFEYINKNFPEIRAIWFTVDNRTLRLIKKKGYEVYLAYSLKGYLLSMQAKVGIVTHGLSDINKWVVGGLKIVHFWHGLPLKPVMYTDRKKIAINDFKKLKKLSYIFPFLKKDIDYKDALIISSSEETRKQYSRIFNTKNVEITGYPKYDGLFLNKPKKQILINFLLEYKNQGFKLGLYAPTYRKNTEFDIVNYLVQNLDIINKRLREIKIILAIRLHPANFKKLIIEHNEGNFLKTNIIIINDMDIEQDIYPVLPLFDFLITEGGNFSFK